MRSLPSSAWVNTSVKELISRLFIQKWTTEISYRNYFDQCAPESCTYSIIERTNFSGGITLLLSLSGGLTCILRLLAPFLVGVVRKMNHQPSMSRSREHLSDWTDSLLVRMASDRHSSSHSIGSKLEYLQISCSPNSSCDQGTTYLYPKLFCTACKSEISLNAHPPFHG